MLRRKSFVQSLLSSVVVVVVVVVVLRGSKQFGMTDLMYLYCYGRIHYVISKAMPIIHISSIMECMLKWRHSTVF